MVGRQNSFSSGDVVGVGRVYGFGMQKGWRDTISDRFPDCKFARNESGVSDVPADGCAGTGGDGGERRSGFEGSESGLHPVDCAKPHTLENV